MIGTLILAVCGVFVVLMMVYYPHGDIDETTRIPDQRADDLRLAGKTPVERQQINERIVAARSAAIERRTAERYEQLHREAQQQHLEARREAWLRGEA